LIQREIFQAFHYYSGKKYRKQAVWNNMYRLGNLWVLEVGVVLGLGEVQVLCVVLRLVGLELVCLELVCLELVVKKEPISNT
jgi:hypothetical protein